MFLKSSTSSQLPLVAHNILSIDRKDFLKARETIEKSNDLNDSLKSFSTVPPYGVNQEKALLFKTQKES